MSSTTSPRKNHSNVPLVCEMIKKLRDEIEYYGDELPEGYQLLQYENYEPGGFVKVDRRKYLLHLEKTLRSPHAIGSCQAEGIQLLVEMCVAGRLEKSPDMGLWGFTLASGLFHSGLVYTENGRKYLESRANGMWKKILFSTWCAYNNPISAKKQHLAVNYLSN